MMPIPVVLLIATVLLTTHIPPSVCRPRDLSIFDGHGYRNQLDEVLLRAGDNAVSYLMGEKIQQYLQRNPVSQKSVLHSPLDNALTAHNSKGLPPLARSLQIIEKGRSQEDENSLEDLGELSKRNEDPPISIDLTFHLLRNMIEMARIENQREQAELNRKYLDEVGK
ncbi:urotensin 1 [Electrophorus electricus]|uniref:urotensin 1 n=1 Tax=Electrophorus electricus TaxID=8005 RepID=UPI0015D0CBFD|nr:urotensin 1 [Electrophorus electricus]